MNWVDSKAIAILVTAMTWVQTSQLTTAEAIVIEIKPISLSHLYDDGIHR